MPELPFEHDTYGKESSRKMSTVEYLKSVTGYSGGAFFLQYANGFFFFFRIGSPCGWEVRRGYDGKPACELERINRVRTGTFVLLVGRMETKMQRSKGA